MLWLCVGLAAARFTNLYRRVQQHGETLLRAEDELGEEVVVERMANYSEPQEYEGLVDRLIGHSKNSTLKTDLLTCDKSNYARNFKFGGEEVAYIGNETDRQTKELKKYPDDCFSRVTVSYRRLSTDSLRLELAGEGKRNATCSEGYFIGTGASLSFRALHFRKHTSIVWKNLSQTQIANVQKWGIHIFRLCDRVLHFLPDIVKTAELFVGGLGTNPDLPFFGAKTPYYQQRLNVKFIEESTGFRWKQRADVFVNLSDAEVHPGDFLAITRFDGVDQIIQYGAGSHSGHSAMVLEVDGEIVVCESQDGWYWPKHGIQRNKWSVWKQWALNAGFNVAVLPLTPAARATFDKAAAEQEFKRLEGLPYGYHNFLFGWIDTANQSLPPLLDPEIIVPLFGFLERIYALPFRMILTEALNKRLNTSNLDLGEIAIEIAERNTTIADLMAVVEKDGWWYSDGWSYVCSAFTAAVYKAGGLLLNVEATEFTPRDIYLLDIFDKTTPPPQKCQKNDPSLPYCQIMGHWLMELPEYATVSPYPHMNEKCPTEAPDFKRTPNC